MLYVVTAIAGGILARILYPGALHITPAASVLLGVPGGQLAGLAGRIFYPQARSSISSSERLAYAIVGSLLLTSVAESALHFFR